MRIFINEELNELEEVLKFSLEILNKESRIIVVAFHSLEDRIIKNFFKKKSIKNPDLKEDKSLQNKYLKIITKKPITPSVNEIKMNPRSRSAKLRVAIRSSDEFADPIKLRNKFKHLTDLEKRIA